MQKFHDQDICWKTINHVVEMERDIKKIFVTRKRFFRELESMKKRVRKISNQNQILIKRFGQMIALRKHYLRHRLKNTRKTKTYAKKLKDLIAWKYHFQKNFKGLQFFGRIRKGGRAHLVRLTQSEYVKLRKFLDCDFRKVNFI